MALFASAPNHRTFFSLLQEAGANIVEATEKLDRLMRDWPDDSGLRGEVKALEEAGDRITHDILHQLYSTAVTPLDREDIHALAAALDDVVDYAEETADVLGLYQIEAPMEQAVELTGVLRDAGTGDRRGAGQARLARLDLAPPGRASIAWRTRATASAARRWCTLFSGGIDPMVVIRWKDVFERLEQAIDACERVAHVLEGIVVKQA